MPTDFSGLRALDVGFGVGNNLRFLSSLGMRVSGTEISGELCKSIGDLLVADGVTADLRVGKNTELPFEDKTFDFLVSWNVLHYEDNEDDMIRAIKEYARVLKSGGRLLLSTTGPKHKILEGARALGGHRYEIGRADDFRRGTVYFYFDSEEYLHYYFGLGFSNVQTGRTEDRLITSTLDWFIVTATA
jgi:SAM-dependent methyltransferase